MRRASGKDLSEPMTRIWLAILMSIIACLSYGQERTPIPSAQKERRPPWRLPPDRYVQVLGHRLHYYDKGSGTVLLLVHGGSGSAGVEWGRVIDPLATSHRVIAVHQIGFAPSDQPEIAYDTAS